MTDQPPGTDERVRLTAFVNGRVQGVGFRWWTRVRGLELGLVGKAINKPDGRVEVIAEGPRAACEQLVRLLREGRPPGHVSHVSERYAEPRGDLVGFVEA
ncbi:acylphosphatase [Nakamurella lactea]|uniref:acylphosphatase n=1 Tax=Nakamurella lactea TaxID=459515 RepID=UPI00041BFC42|nr:acylphosphatase [Nakamurella lactea]